VDVEAWYRKKVVELDRELKRARVAQQALSNQLDVQRETCAAALQEATACRDRLQRMEQAWGWRFSQSIARLLPGLARWRHQRTAAVDEAALIPAEAVTTAEDAADIPSVVPPVMERPSPIENAMPIRDEASAEGRVVPTLSLCKVCGLEDFRHPRLRPVMRDVFQHEQDRFGPLFPDGVEWRKYWEIAMAVLTFREAGLLRDDVRVLGVGAGNEPTLFYLTRYVGEVLATDLYDHEDGDWIECANRSMLDDPDLHWPFWYRRERLQVRHMNALALDLPDDSVDAIFSSSSIEHFGGAEEINQAVDEMYRVLKPGGVLSLASEFRLAGPSMGVPGLAMFARADLERLLIGRRDWTLMEAFDDAVSTATLATEQSLAVVHPQLHAQYEALGGYWSHHVVFPRYPHLVLKTGAHRFTSFHLALQKAR
jgi:SAM-dependent methyltransferase